MTGGSQTLAGWSSSANVIMQDDANFTTSTGIPLGVALDNTNLIWTTSGDGYWFGEDSVSYDGVSAAQSSSLMDEEAAVLQTTVTGPGTISFYWQTAGEADEFDLEFDDNGGYVNDIGSQTPWSQFTYDVPSGTHTLTWTATSGDGSSPDDAGYVDEVVFTGAPAASAGNWTQTGAMIVDRGEFTLTVLNNGKALGGRRLDRGFSGSIHEPGGFV